MAAITLLAACGQKGPLVLVNPTAPAPVVSSTTSGVLSPVSTASAPAAR